MDMITNVLDILKLATPTNGVLITVDGTITQIAPKNGKDFSFKGELYDLLKCETIEILGCGGDHIFAANEDVPDGCPVNRLASLLWQKVYETDEIGLRGDVFLCLDSMIK